MKTIIRIRLLLIASLVLVFNSCLQDKYNQIQSGIDNTQPVSYTGFEFKTVQEYDVAIQALNNQNLPISGVPLQLFVANPLDASGQFISEMKGKEVFSGITNQQGVFTCKINPPALNDSLYILSNYIGLPSLSIVSLNNNNNNITIQIGGNPSLLKSEKLSVTQSALKSAVASTPVPTLVNGYYTLGTWNNQGVPNYMEQTNDVISNDLLADITASLPEYTSLLKTHPQYIAKGNNANLDVLQDAQVWITFVHEGAGWTNALGYYTYPTKGSQPIKKQDIRDLTIIFPNVSFLNSGGGLISGDKVQLLYLDPQTNTYTSTFSKGTSIGWFLISQGWNSSSHTISNGAYSLYSNYTLNPEPDENLRRHNVILNYPRQNLLLLSFEDWRRDQGSDQDFNDAIFYATLNPVTAVNHSEYESTDTPLDSDGDGISDANDQYPKDPAKTYNNYYPAANQYGSLVFEDLWPYKGDYDFNDLVVGYNFNQITNGTNEVVAINSKIVVRAIGASYHNAFGISLNTNPENISTITGQRNTKGYLNIASNGTENGQSKATAIFFDDAYNVLPYPGTGLYVNTSPDAPSETPDTLIVNITLKTPVAASALSTPPYNPFIIVNRNRNVEVHLPNQPPTDLADLKLLGTGQDKSDMNSGKYYVSDYYLPWALNLPVSFDYPAEKQDITKAYLFFNKWAGSHGTSNKDWYLNTSGYRNNSLLYKK
jgi:LruC domain-containing protein